MPAQNASILLNFSRRLNPETPKDLQMTLPKVAALPEIHEGQRGAQDFQAPKESRSRLFAGLHGPRDPARLSLPGGVPHQVAPSKTPIPATGLNLGGARPGFPPCPDPPPSLPNPRRRRRPRVRPQSGSPRLPVPPQPLPPLTMILGPRLLLATVLCLGLGSLVSSSGSSGVRKRGPTVTAKVILRLLQLLLRSRHQGA